MARTPSNLVSSVSRPLRLRRRSDLVAERQHYQGEAFWVVKDPLTLKYFRFHQEEFALLEMLNGERSLEEIQRLFERRFAPQKISFEELTSFVASLHASGLVISDAPNQAVSLLERRRETGRKQLLGSLTNVLAIRVPGIDPDRVLTRLDGIFGWLLFSTPVTILGLLLCAAAATLVTVQFAAFRAALPTFGEFFALENWFWLALTLAATKILHEFGHGLVCKRQGGECHEMGVLFLVLTPCLYVDVSDSWMLPSKWKRAAIGAAGMYVELVLASICTFVWWFTEPGLLNYLCLNVMFISSVSTLLFNANPLLKYDGYYILSDILEIPNLRTKASAVLRGQLQNWLLGVEPTPDPFLPTRHRWLFAVYSVAAAVYRWVVLFSILWFLQSVFKPYGLEVVGQMIALVAMWGLVVWPVWQLVQFFRVPGRVDKVNRMRAALSLAGAVVAVAALLYLPLPYYVESPFQLQPRGAANVYVDVPGRLAEIHVRPGERVHRGQQLVSLDNLDVELTLAHLDGERANLTARVDDLRRRQFLDSQAAMELASAEQSLRAVNEQWSKRREDLQKLRVNAPLEGHVIPPPAKPEKALAEDELGEWAGNPLEPMNVDASLDAGVLLCRVGDPTQLVAVIDVDQSDVEFVRAGQNVRLKLDALPGDTFFTTVGEVAQLERETHDHETSRSVQEKLLTTRYQASAALENGEGVLLPGATGRARIRVGSRTVGERLWRYLSQTFRFNR